MFYGAPAQCLFVLFWFPPCHVSSLYGHISMYLVMLKSKIWLYIWLYGTLDFQVSLINWIFFWNICQSVLIFIVVHSTLQTWEDYAWRNGPAKHYISFIRKPNSVFSISCFVIFFSFLKMSWYEKRKKRLCVLPGHFIKH